MGKELRDDRVDQAGRWGKECRSTMLKVAVIGVMGALLALLLKGEKAGQSLWVVLAACLCLGNNRALKGNTSLRIYENVFCCVS